MAQSLQNKEHAEALNLVQMLQKSKHYELLETGVEDQVGQDSEMDPNSMTTEQL